MDGMPLKTVATWIERRFVSFNSDSSGTNGLKHRTDYRLLKGR